MRGHTSDASTYDYSSENVLLWKIAHTAVLLHGRTTAAGAHFRLFAGQWPA